jgi:hypothetical protein
MPAYELRRARPRRVPGFSSNSGFTPRSGSFTVAARDRDFRRGAALGQNEFERRRQSRRGYCGDRVRQTSPRSRRFPWFSAPREENLAPTNASTRAPSERLNSCMSSNVISTLLAPANEPRDRDPDKSIRGLKGMHPKHRPDPKTRCVRGGLKTLETGGSVLPGDWQKLTNQS